MRLAQGLVLETAGREPQGRASPALFEPASGKDHNVCPVRAQGSRLQQLASGGVCERRGRLDVEALGRQVASGRHDLLVVGHGGAAAAISESCQYLAAANRAAGGHALGDRAAALDRGNIIGAGLESRVDRGAGGRLNRVQAARPAARSPQAREGRAAPRARSPAS